MKTGEKGFTYIELLVAISIIALVGGAANMTTFQVFKGTERNDIHMTAIRQVQNAGYMISRDAEMAQKVTVDDLTPPDFLVLNWTNGDTGDGYQIAYTLEDMLEGGLKNLLRNQSINGEANGTMLVAQYINPDAGKTRCDFTDGTLTLTVTATVSDGSQTKNETRIYKLVPRPG